MGIRIGGALRMSADFGLEELVLAAAPSKLLATSLVMTTALIFACTFFFFIFAVLVCNSASLDCRGSRKKIISLLY